MEHYYENIGENWFSYPNLYRGMVQRFDNALFVEVGCWKGRSVCFLAVEIINAKKNISVHAVDLFEYSDQQSDIIEKHYENIYDQFIHNIEPVKDVVKPIKGNSVDVSKTYPLESIDFVFIDAAHDFHNAFQDISAWFGRVKQGGVIAGHDYNSSAGVKKAVDMFFGESNILNTDNCWIYEKRKHA